MELNRLYAQLVRPGDIVYDIGANNGMSAHVFSRLVGPQGRCVSFECHPAHFAMLTMLVAQPRFANVLPYHRALSATAGHAVMYAGTDPAAAQASTIVTELANPGRLGAKIIQFKVETDTVDRLVASTGLRPSLLKIDVEGAEEQVLAGAAGYLASDRPAVVFEFGHQLTRTGAPAHFARLRDLGYDFHLIDLNHFRGSGQDLPVLPDALIAITIDDLVAVAPVGGNVLALPPERRDRLASALLSCPLPWAETAARA